MGKRAGSFFGLVAAGARKSRVAIDPESYNVKGKAQ
jgi:hypothetical protein